MEGMTKGQQMNENPFMCKPEPLYINASQNKTLRGWASRNVVTIQKVAARSIQLGRCLRILILDSSSTVKMSNSNRDHQFSMINFLLLH